MGEITNRLYTNDVAIFIDMGLAGFDNLAVELENVSVDGPEQFNGLELSVVVGRHDGVNEDAEENLGIKLLVFNGLGELFEVDKASDLVGLDSGFSHSFSQCGHVAHDELDDFFGDFLLH